VNTNKPISSSKSFKKTTKETNDIISTDDNNDKIDKNSDDTKSNKNTEINTEITDDDQNNTESNDNNDKNNVWIDVMYDPFNGIQTISDCMSLIDVDGTNQHHLVIADFGNYRNNKYMKSVSKLSMNDDTNQTNKNAESDLSDSKKIGEKRALLKNKTSSVLLSKNDVAQNDNKTGFPVLKIFKGKL